MQVSSVSQAWEAWSTVLTEAEYPEPLDHAKDEMDRHFQRGAHVTFLLIGNLPDWNSNQTNCFHAQI